MILERARRKLRKKMRRRRRRRRRRGITRRGGAERGGKEEGNRITMARNRQPRRQSGEGVRVATGWEDGDGLRGEK